MVLIWFLNLFIFITYILIITQYICLNVTSYVFYVFFFNVYLCHLVLINENKKWIQNYLYSYHLIKKFSFFTTHCILYWDKIKKKLTYRSVFYIYLFIYYFSRSHWKLKRTFFYEYQVHWTLLLNVRFSLVILPSIINLFSMLYVSSLTFPKHEFWFSMVIRHSSFIVKKIHLYYCNVCLLRYEEVIRCFTNMFTYFLLLRKYRNHYFIIFVDLSRNMKCANKNVISNTFISNHTARNLSIELLMG